jgi:ATP-dependent 26S proteasome regulatory subunit
MILSEVCFCLLLVTDCLFYLKVCTSEMNLSDEVDLEDYVSRLDKISVGDVSAFHSSDFLIFLKSTMKFILSILI